MMPDTPTAFATSDMNLVPAAPTNILLVEDDPEISALLAGVLAENGFGTTAAASGAEMDQVLRERAFDLVVLDVMLPGEDGLSICRRLRALGPTPIIMVTALGEEIDRVVGLEIGADDYVTKPFNPRELIARIRALLRRSTYSAPAGRAGLPLRFAKWQVYPASRKVLDPDGVRISMTTAEFDLLLAFCRNPCRVLTREQLLALTHAGLAGPIERSIDVHVSRVRRKIEPDPRDPIFIKTVRLGGYIFTPTVESG